MCQDDLSLVDEANSSWEEVMFFECMKSYIYKLHFILQEVALDSRHKKDGGHKKGATPKSK